MSKTVKENLEKNQAPGNYTVKNVSQNGLKLVLVRQENQPLDTYAVKNVSQNGLKISLVRT